MVHCTHGARRRHSRGAERCPRDWLEGALDEVCRAQTRPERLGEAEDGEQAVEVTRSSA